MDSAPVPSEIHMLGISGMDLSRSGVSVRDAVACLNRGTCYRDVPLSCALPKPTVTHLRIQPSASGCITDVRFHFCLRQVSIVET